MRARVVKLAVAVGAIVAISTAAFAYFTTTGTGSASATTGSLVAPSNVTALQSGANVSVSWTAGSVAPAGTLSGYYVKRVDGSDNESAACGSSPSSLISGTSCSDTGLPSGTYRYVVTAVFRSWTAASAPSDPISFVADAIAPTSSASISPTANAAGWNTGAVTVTLTATDNAGGSGVKEIRYTTNGDTPTASSTLHTAPFNVSQTATVKFFAIDNAGNAESPANSKDIKIDGNAPTGGSVTANGSGAYNKTGTIALSVTPFADGAGESGLAAGSNAVTRASASLIDDACGSFSGSTAVTVSGGNDSASLNNGCYRYTLSATDVAGNQATTTSAIVKVDKSDPTTPTLTLSNATGSTFVSGTTAYTNPQAGKSGAFDISASSFSDPDTGALKLLFPDLTGFTGGIEIPAPGPYSTTYSWSGAGATASGSQNVRAYNRATGNSIAAFSIVQDATGPVGGALTVNGTVASSAGSESFATTGTVTLSGRADFTETLSATQSGLASSVLIRDDSALTNGSCGSVWANAQTITAGTTSQTGLASGKCYRYTLTGTDRVGNVSIVRSTVKVDSSAPVAPTLSLSAVSGNTYVNGSTVFLNPSSGNTGSFKVAATGSDAESGIARVTFPTIVGYTGGGNVFSAPFEMIYGWTSSSTTTGAQSVTATNGSGLSSPGSSFTITHDTVAPVNGAISPGGATFTDVGSVKYTNSNSYTIGVTPFTDAGSGIASNVRTRRVGALNTSTSACSTTSSAAFASPLTESGLADGCYEYEILGTDNVGNSSKVSQIVNVDRTRPTATNVALANAGTVGVANTGDTATITYAEMIDPVTFCSSWTGDKTADKSLTANGDVTVTITDSGSNDVLTVSSSGCTLQVGSIALGANYVNSTKTFSGNNAQKSTVEWFAASKQLVITLGNSGGPTPPAAAASTPSYAPHANVADLAGNLIAAGPFAGTSSRF